MKKTAILGILAVLALAASAQADITNWTAGTGTFSDLANWDGGIPSATLTAQFNADATANFTGAAASQGLNVTAGTTTLNLAGNTYDANKNGGMLVLGTDATHSGNLAVSGGGTLNVKMTDGYEYGSLQISGSGTTVAYTGTFYTGYNNIITVNAGYFDGTSVSAGTHNISNSVNISNGGRWDVSAVRYLTLGSYGGGAALITGTGSRLQGGYIKLIGTPTTVENGGLLTASNALGLELQGYFGGTGGLTVGTAGGAGALANVNTTVLTVGTTAAGGGPLVTVYSDGKVTASGSTVATALTVSPYGTFSMQGGAVAIGAGKALDVQSSGANHGVLRGVGTIERSGVSGGNFSLTNTTGYLKPGDISATAAIGALNVINGDLAQSSGTTYFDFDSTTNDLIAITGGYAAFSGGSLNFSTLSYTPVKGVAKTWDFVTTASGYTITTGAGDNLSTLLSGWDRGTDYKFGVVDTAGGGQALRLEIVPEPGALALLVLGGVGMLLRRRRA